MHIRSFLNSRGSLQFDIAGCRRISRFICAPNGARWRTTTGIGTFAHQANVSFGDRFFKTLVSSLCNKHGQFVRLKIETWISHLHSAAKDAQVLGRIKKRFVSIDFRRRRFVRVQTHRALAQQLTGTGFLLFLGCCFFLCLFYGRRSNRFGRS